MKQAKQIKQKSDAKAQTKWQNPTKQSIKKKKKKKEQAQEYTQNKF